MCLILSFHYYYYYSLVCSTSQVSNGHILVVIHITTASQTIKVSIDDTPAQVDKCRDGHFLRVYQLQFYYSTIFYTVFRLFSFLFRYWQAFSQRQLIKDFCWASLKTCVRQTMCCVCVAGMSGATRSAVIPELLIQVVSVIKFALKGN